MNKRIVVRLMFNNLNEIDITLSKLINYDNMFSLTFMNSTIVFNAFIKGECKKLLIRKE